jgi:hypothetical protein
MFASCATMHVMQSATGIIEYSFSFLWRHPMQKNLRLVVLIPLEAVVIQSVYTIVVRV